MRSWLSAFASGEHFEFRHGVDNSLLFCPTESRANANTASRTKRRPRRTARTPTLSGYAMGLFTLGLAYFLRAGAMFVLPFLLLWPFFLFSTRRVQWQATVLGVVALTIVALTHIAVSRTLTPDSPSFVNAPKSWYAIIAMGDAARGLRADRPVREEARWLQIFDDHPGLHDRPIAEQGRRFIEILTENALERPLSVLVGAAPMLSLGQCRVTGTDHSQIKNDSQQ